MPLIEHESEMGNLGQANEPSSMQGLVAYSLLLSRWTIAACGVLGGLLGFLYGAIQPNVFEASGKLLIHVGKRESTTPEVALGLDTGRAAGMQEAIATEMHVLGNPVLIEQLVRKLGAERFLRVPDPGAADTEDTPVPVRWLHRFQAWFFGADPSAKKDATPVLASRAEAIAAGSLTLAAEPRANVITVRYRSPDPVLARDAVDAFLTLADARHRDVFSADSGIAILKAQEQSAWRACEAANVALADFRGKHGLYDFDAQKAGLIDEIRQLEAQIYRDDREAERLQARLGFIESALKEAASAPSVPVPNPARVRLQAEMSDLRSRKLDATARPGEKPIDFRARMETLDRLIAAVQEELARAPEFPNQPNARKAQLQARHDEAQESMAAIIATQKSQRARLDERKERLNQLRDLEAQNTSLALEAEQCRERSERFTKSLQSAGLLSFLDQQELGNLRPFETARVPENKVSPNRGKFLLMGGALGFFAGLALALMRTITDSRVVRSVDLKARTRSSVLSIVKDLRIGRSKTDGAVIRGVEGRSPYQHLIDNLWSRILPETRPVGQIKIGFVGTETGQGCSTVAAAAALGLALRTRQPVLVIETGFDSPGLARCFGLEDAPGLSEVLAGEVNLEDAIQETPVPGLSVMCAGRGPRPEPGTFSSEATMKVLQRAIECCHFAVFDLAPINEDPDSRVLLWEVDSVVAVVRSKDARKEDVRTLAETVRARGANLVGCVLNRYRSVWPFWMPGDDPELRV